MHSALLNSHQLIDSPSRSASILLCSVFSVCDSGGQTRGNECPAELDVGAPLKITTMAAAATRLAPSEWSPCQCGHCLGAIM